MNRDPSSTKTEYRIARQVVLRNFICLALSIGLLGFVLWMRWSAPLKDSDTSAFYMMLGICIGSVLVFIVSIRRQSAYITVSNHGIEQHSRDGSLHYLNWGDIASITNNKIKGQLELIPVNRFQKKIIVADYQLADFAQLKNTIYENTKIHDQDLNLTTFHRSSHLYLMVGLLLIPCGIMALKSGSLIPWVVFIIFTLVVRLVNRRELTSVTFHSGFISLNYPKQSRSITFDEIRNVSITSPKGIDIVILETDHSRPLRLGGFREGTLPFYRRLKFALEQHSQQSAATPAFDRKIKD